MHMAVAEPDSRLLLCSFVASFYDFNILALQASANQLKNAITISKIRYELLRLLSAGLSDELVLKEPEAVLKIVRSISVDEPVLASEMLVLLGRVLAIFNMEMVPYSG